MEAHMPTGADAVNPQGLMKAARRGRDTQARVIAAAEALRAQIAASEDFARRFDEAVMRQNHRAILALVDEVGLPDEAEVRVLDLDADRRIRIEICVFGVCVSITIEW
jgi:ribosomal protein L16 Arg81 hydroxylase